MLVKANKEILWAQKESVSKHTADLVTAILFYYMMMECISISYMKVFVNCVDRVTKYREMRRGKNIDL